MKNQKEIELTEREKLVLCSYFLPPKVREAQKITRDEFLTISERVYGIYFPLPNEVGFPGYVAFGKNEGMNFFKSCDGIGKLIAKQCAILYSQDLRCEAHNLFMLKVYKKDTIPYILSLKSKVNPKYLLIKEL